jgi:hypothetical protein
MGTRLVAWAGVVAIVVVAAGCGGEDSSTGGPSISKEAFIAKVDAICKRGNGRVEVAFADFLEENKDLKRPKPADFEGLVGDVLVPSVKREIEEVRALGAPDGDEEDVDEMVDALEEGVETAERNPKAVTNSSDAVFGIASRLAEEYGLEVCGSR